MARNTTTPLSPADAEAAREAKRTRDRERQANVRKVNGRLREAGLDTAYPDLTAEQRTRALDESKAGLTGTSLAKWITEGKTGRQQIEAARAADQAERAEERTRANITRSSDQEAAELAVAAKALAPTVKSAFLPKDAREALDLFTVQRSGVDEVLIARLNPEEGGLAEATVPMRELRDFSIEGTKVPEVRAALAGLGKGSRLWGRKLGLMMLARLG